MKSYRHAFSDSGAQDGNYILYNIFDGDLYQKYHLGELDLFKDPHDVALYLLLDGTDLTTGRIKHLVSKLNKLHVPTDCIR